MKNNLSSLFAYFHTKYPMPYGMVIVSVFSVTALFESVRPAVNVVLAPNVTAAFASGMMVPMNKLVAPIEAAPVGTQYTHVLVEFTPGPNVT